MVLLDHAFFTNHLIVVVLLNDVQFDGSILTIVIIIQGIPQLFTSFVTEIHILPMICMCSNHCTDREYVGFLIGLLLISSELTLRLVIGYPKHTHDNQSQYGPQFSSLEVHVSEMSRPQCINKSSHKIKVSKIRLLEC
jgi:hypothetical protein